MTKIFQLHPLAKIVRYSARVHGKPELGLYEGRFAALKADINMHMYALESKVFMQSLKNIYVAFK